MYTQDTICAVATAQGGAIGIIRVSGPEAITVADRIFSPANQGGLPLSGRKPYTLTFGTIRDAGGEVVDEGWSACSVRPIPIRAKIRSRFPATVPRTSSSRSCNFSSGTDVVPPVRESLPSVLS